MKDSRSYATAQSCSVSRRTFLTGAAASAAALVAPAVAGCTPTPKSQELSSASEEFSPNSSDWLGESPQISDDQITETLSTDLLIVGAGNGGMIAAATAAEAGLDFLIAEKNNIVAEARYYTGMVSPTLMEEQGVNLDKDRLLNELARYASYKCKQSVIKTWIEESGETLDFIASVFAREGASPRIVIDPNAELHKDYYTSPTDVRFYRDSDGEFAPADGTMDRNKVLERYLENKGHDILFSYELVSLDQDDSKRVSSALFATKDGYTRINAHSIILATGGYAANPEMVRAINPLVDRCVTAASWNPSCDGGGIKAALRIGAAKCQEPAPMIFDRGVVAPGIDAGYEGEGASATLPGTVFQFNLGSQPFLAVNRLGKRFVNESVPYDFKCFAASENPGGVWCQVFDSTAKEDVARFATTGCSFWTQVSMASDAPLDEIYAAELEQGLLLKADTLEELATAIDVPYDQFSETVARYNELFEKQHDDDFGKAAYRLSSLDTPPYYAAWYGGSLLTTLDGLEINEHMQVLDENGAIIEGLYAVGDCSGSFFSGNYPEYFVGVAAGRTVTFGRHAVRHIAEAQ